MSKDVTKTEDSLESFVERLWSQGDARLQDCFKIACEVEEYMRIVHDKAVVDSSRYIPKIIENVAGQALSGSLEASRILLDITGITGKKGSGTPVNVLNQINITESEKEDLRKDFLDV